MDTFKSMVESPAYNHPVLYLNDLAQTPKATLSHKPLLHFASELLAFVQLKSMLVDFFDGEVMDSICLAELEQRVARVDARRAERCADDSRGGVGGGASVGAGDQFSLLLVIDIAIMGVLT